MGLSDPCVGAEIVGNDCETGDDPLTVPGTSQRASLFPFIDFSFVENVPCKTNPSGVKGAGEAGAIGAPPAVVNAVVDALSDAGIEHIDMPVTPERIWRALRGQ